MDQNTEGDVLKRSQRNCCICGTTARKIYFLILLIAVFHIAIWGSLVAAHLYQRNELLELRTASAKAIAECRRHAALVNAKLQKDPADNLSTQRNISSKFIRDIKQSQQPRNVALPLANSKLPPSCPYNSKKRRKLCSFIAKEVSRQVQLNMTELRKEIKKVIDAEDRSPKAYANVLGVYRQTGLLKIAGTDMYTMVWDSTFLRKMPNGQPQKKNIARYRLTRFSGMDKIQSSKRNIYGVKVKEAGTYFVYCQLTFVVNDSRNSEDVAHLISKITILMSKGANEHIELISQIPVLTRQGNKRVITVSMFTQAYLYSQSKVRVTISLRNVPGPHPSGRTEVELYNNFVSSATFNVFGMYLLKRTDDQP